MGQRELVRCDGQKHVNECQDSRMMQKYQVSLHRYVKLTQNKSSQDENKRLESRDNLHRANCCLPPKFLLLSRPAPICKPIHFHLYRNLYFINNNTLDMVLYYFFCLKMICLVFTQKNIYMVHFLFTILSSCILNVLVILRNTQPYFQILLIIPFFMFSCSLNRGFFLKFLKSKHQMTSGLKGNKPEERGKNRVKSSQPLTTGLECNDSKMY